MKSTLNPYLQHFLKGGIAGVLIVTLTFLVVFGLGWARILERAPLSSVTMNVFFLVTMIFSWPYYVLGFTDGGNFAGSMGFVAHMISFILSAFVTTGAYYVIFKFVSSKIR